MADRKEPRDRKTREKNGSSAPLPLPPADSPRRIGREPAVDREAIAAREAGIYDESDGPPRRAAPRRERPKREKPSRPRRERRPRPSAAEEPEAAEPEPAPEPRREPAPEPEPEPEPEEDPFLAGIFVEEEEEEAEPEPEPEPEQEEEGPPAGEEEPSAEPKPAAEEPAAEPEPSPAGVSARWTREVYGPAVEKRAERKAEFRTSSGHLLGPLYGLDREAGESFDAKVGYPGEPPFTRGIHPTMYRTRLWTMRQYAGFASAEATNERFRYLLGQGQTGLSVAFDLPTQIGYDSDDPWSAGEVGKVGVPINSLADMEQLLEGIPLDQVSLSMTINSTAIVLLLMVAAVAKKQGVDPAELNGTVQNDMLKEFAARNTFRFPLDAHLRLTTDLFRYCRGNLPKWNLISVSGYHMREAGCTAAQEVAFTLANGIAYVEKAVEAGLSVDDFAGRISFFFAAHNDLIEEVAKFRAARRMWAGIMKERFGADSPRARMLRFHTQTAGSTLTAKQPIVNTARVTLQALAAALGGTQSLHTNSWDEALGLPSQESALLALRTQQVIAHESGVANVVDPLGGSPLVEALTDSIEKDATSLIAKIDELGGAVEAVRTGWMKGEIEASAYAAQKAIESGDQVVVGVNEYVMDEELEPDVLGIDEAEVRRVTESLARLKEERNRGRAEAALASLEISAAWGDADLPELLMECVESYCTIGEICRVLETVLGE